MEIKVKISNGKINYKDKDNGTAKEMECVVLEFPNGKTINLVSNRFNYRVYDYLTELLNGK